MRSTSLAFLLIGCLFVSGCDGLRYVAKTDLSVLEIGTGRDQVEAALGAPTKVRSENEAQVATYDYNSTGRYWPDCLPTYPCFGALAATENYQKQRGKLEVAYDANQNVIWYRSDIVGSLEAIDTAICETPLTQAVR